MPTNLDRQIAAALQTAAHPSAETGSFEMASFTEANHEGARRKADDVLRLLKADDYNLRNLRPVFVSIGGGDGEELLHLLQHSDASHGILLELDAQIAKSASMRKLPEGKQL